MDENKVINKEERSSSCSEPLTLEETSMVSGGFEPEDAPQKTCPHCLHDEGVIVQMNCVAEWHSQDNVAGKSSWGYDYRCPRCNRKAKYYMG